MTNDVREETGYTPIKRDKERVAIADYGKTAEADAAKKQVKELIKQLERVRK
jgi:hypothetical protein